ncbi:hypothetical protein U1Q18_025689 [Sarracenia purpurea var. burkii]
MQEVFRSEIISLESEIEGYNTCPDALLSMKTAASEARIRKFKDLSPAMVKEVRAFCDGFSENEVKAEASDGEEKREVQEKTTALWDSTVQPDGSSNLPRQGIKKSRTQGFARFTGPTKLSARSFPQQWVISRDQPGFLPAELACSTLPQSPTAQVSLFIKAIEGLGKRGHGSSC